MPLPIPGLSFSDNSVKVSNANSAQNSLSLAFTPTIANTFSSPGTVVSPSAPVSQQPSQTASQPVTQPSTYTVTPWSPPSGGGGDGALPWQYSYPQYTTPGGRYDTSQPAADVQPVAADAGGLDMMPLLLMGGAALLLLN